MQVLKRGLLILFVTVFTTESFGQVDTFNQIYQQIRQHNYFKAKELLQNNSGLSEVHRIYTEAILNNAFNKLEASEKAISTLIRREEALADTMVLKLYETRYDNAVKQYSYEKAGQSIQKLLNAYEQKLDAEQVADYQNSLKIWNALAHIAPQEVTIKERTVLKIQKDSAGLNTLRTTVNSNVLPFVFDTGANLSTTSLSVAKNLGMEIVPVAIEVDAITGNKVKAQLAVCKKLSIGSISLRNVIFLVLPDEALSFPQINYKINGILGFPVIEALKEIRITRDGDFIVPLKRSQKSGISNLAMNGLTPLIHLDGKHFSFDTGANKSLLYPRFYRENQGYIDGNYQLQKISFGGAGGNKELDGYKIDYKFRLREKYIELPNINLLKEKVEDHGTVYGNIGQDLIRQFDAMIINFDKMFVQFD